MRKLQRGAAPSCLAQYRHGRHQWRSVSPDHRTEIWGALEAMQGGVCAYCEASIGVDNRHIEHFRQRRHEPAATFQWSNLFGSCDHQLSCGRHKDACGFYEAEVLLKPDIDDASDYWAFVSDGTIQVLQSLDDRQRLRAEQSLRIFNLDAVNGRLRHMRREAIRPYLETAEVLAQLREQVSQEEFTTLLDDELQAVDQQPFATAIRQLFCGR